MALRTRIAGTTTAATSGPGRAPGSDGRARPGRRGSPAGGLRRGSRTRRPIPAGGAATRRRGEALFPPASGVPLPPTAGDGADGPPVDRQAPETDPPGGTREERAGPTLGERLALALRERLPVWVQVRCGLEPRTLAALTVILVVAAGVAGRYFWTGRPEAVRAPEIVRAASPPGRGGPAAAPAVPMALEGPAGPVTGARSAAVVVDVNGKVRRPGVLTLPAGSRVADALRAAGGVRPGADLTGLNRARVLMDGEQVVVGLPAAAAGGGPGSGLGPGAAGGVAGTRAAPLSLNAATVEQLDALPGVGPVLARHILDHRTEHGGFRTVAELREVNGIGERRFADLAPLVRP
ncbi:helix-hairpin-helix domain-containing protein [Streptomyces sp. NPDC085614]|uniref:helix-hairpin-helix domain-containing protein n=1 Tax=Streptomyces sp. NPDC085614 TaxID=3365733 RepID=UPI0037D1830F